MSARGVIRSVAIAVIVLAGAAGAYAIVALPVKAPAEGPAKERGPRAPKPAAGSAEAAAQATGGYDAVAPRAALVFDVGSGKTLYSLNPDQRMPIASLTKMMTALLVAEHHSPDEQMMISAKAAAVPGSRVGVLPKGKYVPLGPVFVGMLLESGNDAAEALAEHDAGTEAAFVARMNRRATALGMSCTHYTTPHGLQDKGNYSCAKDLATLARTDLQNPWIRQVAALKKATYPFPIPGGKIDLVNNDYFVDAGLRTIPGAVVTGLKTGYTDPAGRCYVVTAQVGAKEIGVVLLHSPDPLHQVPLLMERGIAADG